MRDATKTALSGDDVAVGSTAGEQQEMLSAVGGASEIASGRDERTGFFHARTNLQLEVSATPRPCASRGER